MSTHKNSSPSDVYEIVIGALDRSFSKAEELGDAISYKMDNKDRIVVYTHENKVILRCISDKDCSLLVQMVIDSEGVSKKEIFFGGRKYGNFIENFANYINTEIHEKAKNPH